MFAKLLLHVTRLLTLQSFLVIRLVLEIRGVVSSFEEQLLLNLAYSFLNIKQLQYIIGEL